MSMLLRAKMPQLLSVKYVNILQPEQTLTDAALEGKRREETGI